MALIFLLFAAASASDQSHVHVLTTSVLENDSHLLAVTENGPPVPEQDLMEKRLDNTRPSVEESTCEELFF